MRNTASIDNVFGRPKVVLSMSGGMDSTCLALYYLSKGYEVRAYGFDYGQRHSVELKRLRKNIDFLSGKKQLPISLQIINLRDVFSGSVCSMHKESGNEIPEGLYNEENMKSTVEPNRNVIFSAIVFAKALNWALKTDSEVKISLGAHSGDHSIYPDCQPESIEACKRAYAVSNWDSDRVTYDAPFVSIDKAQVLKEGLDAMRALGFSDKDVNTTLANTNTCYNPDKKGRSCGKCGSCTERAYAFYMNNLNDPAPHQKTDQELWEIGRKIYEDIASERLSEAAGCDLHPDTHHTDHAV